MASSTIVLKNLADADLTYSLVGQTSNGAVYRDASLALSTPRSLTITTKVGQPGSLGNDKVTCRLALSMANAADTGIITGGVTCSLSIPRDTGWASSDTVNLLVQLQDLFSDANAAVFADAMVP